MRNTLYLPLALSWVLLASGCGGPKGVVTLEPYLTETVCALGLGGDLVAVSAADDYPPETLSILRVGDSNAPDVAAIESVHAALVLAPHAADGLTTPVFPAARPERLDAIPDLILAVGLQLGALSSAEQLVAALASEQSDLQQALAGKDTPRTLVVLDRPAGEMGVFRCAGPGHLAYDLAALAGTENVLDAASGTAVELTLEDIVALAPEVILEFLPGQSLTENQRQARFNDWNAAPDLPARRSAQIHSITESHALRPGPRIIAFARELAITIHGNFDYEREVTARAG